MKVEHLTEEEKQALVERLDPSGRYSNRRMCTEGQIAHLIADDHRIDAWEVLLTSDDDERSNAA